MKATNNYRILLVEDEENIRAALKLNLEMEGYEVVEAIDGAQAVQLFQQQHFHLILLDIMLPEISGLQVCEQVRLHNSHIPILFLTAKDTTADRILGLKQGADDYLTKPFHLEELLLRVNNLLKRSATAPIVEADRCSFGLNEVDFITYQATTPSGSFTLTKKEALLLKYLVSQANQPVSRQQILHAVWGYDVYPSTRTIDNFILAFRKYFEPNPKQPKHFLSVRGVGYKFVP